MFELVTVEMLVKATGLSETHIRSMERRGLMPRARRYGRLLRWEKSELEGWSPGIGERLGEGGAGGEVNDDGEVRELAIVKAGKAGVARKGVAVEVGGVFDDGGESS
jgi:predicted DNA-binding transcriptional regulator AlpA